MRVAIVCYYAPPLRSAASHRVLRMTRALLRAGHEVHWVAADPDRMPDPHRSLDESLRIVKRACGPEHCFPAAEPEPLAKAIAHVIESRPPDTAPIPACRPMAVCRPLLGHLEPGGLH